MHPLLKISLLTPLLLHPTNFGELYFHFHLNAQKKSTQIITVQLNEFSQSEYIILISPRSRNKTCPNRWIDS